MKIKYLALSSVLLVSVAFAGERGDVANHAAPVEHEAGCEDSGDFTGLFAGAGAGIDFNTIKVSDSSSKTLVDKTPTSFGVVALFGYGHTLENRVHVGGEASLAAKFSSDEAGAKAKSVNYGFFAKVGYDFDNAPILLGGLLGFGNSGVEYKKDKHEISGSKVRPQAGAFAQYKVGDGCSVRADVIYSFKSDNTETNKVANQVAPNKSLKWENKKWGVRAMVVYNF